MMRLFLLLKSAHYLLTIYSKERIYIYSTEQSFYNLYFIFPHKQAKNKRTALTCGFHEKWR